MNATVECKPCYDRAILLGNVFKVPEKPVNIFDLVKEAEEYHFIRESSVC